ncbi:PF07220 domain protein [Leptospira interrogans serovar Grippotyphosa str. LT2186]|uniref:PF07220 domain protein n=1 Tax=Leptospira interrogans serovar Grippotyphosa str. LT2186 TaxID=1001599 RepID=M3I7W5_LEPIR|nr:PF07220 domain protein [Leptospira interrogans serovar Grippotyphosa str. LT2186]
MLYYYRNIDRLHFLREKLYLLDWAKFVNFDSIIASPYLKEIKAKM